MAWTYSNNEFIKKTLKILEFSKYFKLHIFK